MNQPGHRAPTTLLRWPGIPPHPLEIDMGANLPATAIYDRHGETTGLYVDEWEDGLYLVRAYGTGAVRSPELRLSAIRVWLSNHNYTCPGLP